MRLLFTDAGLDIQFTRYLSSQRDFVADLFTAQFLPFWDKRFSKDRYDAYKMKITENGKVM